MFFLFSFWHSYDSNVTFKDVLEVPKPLLIFLNCFFILFQLNVHFFLLLQTIDLSPGFLPFTVPCTFSLISLFIAFTFSSILQPYSTISVSILTTSVLNSASDRLPISSLLSSIFRVLICSFTCVTFLCVRVPVTL